MRGEALPRGQRFRLVMFDLDGTLIDTAPEIADAVNAYLAERGLPQVDSTQVRNLIGHGARRLLASVLGHEPNEDEWSGFAQHYLERCGRNSRLYPGVREAVVELRRRGVKLAVVTNKEQRFTRPLLRTHKLLDCFDVLVCGDSLEAKKPNPLPLRHCLDKFRVAAADALYVGDSETDVLTARNAGVAMWAVPYGYNGGEPIEASKPDRVIAGLANLLSA